jgi:plasmid maintenance system killer protein
MFRERETEKYRLNERRHRKIISRLMKPAMEKVNIY